ncbi:hypothetical protein N7G274_003968 [Stereocaulon virgatum]|uniref:Uncharacterized protein n=1 Tax=Stereocaulon virgatum TaxID=373712 RepID=A0ABR4ADW9_9LECA
MFTPQGIVAYEFSHAPRAKPLDDDVSDFLQELAHMLEHLKLTGILGVFALEDKPANSAPKMEFTEGRANITLPFDISGPEKDSIEAMWQFHTASNSVGETATMNPVVYAQCKLRCKLKPNHTSAHLPTKSA